MAEACGYVNQHGIACGLGKHPSTVPHELYVQLVMPDPFCLQPWDRLTPATIRAWIVAAKAHGVSADKIQRAEQSLHDIRRWQLAHGTRIPN